MPADTAIAVQVAHHVSGDEDHTPAHAGLQPESDAEQQENAPPPADALAAAEYPSGASAATAAQAAELSPGSPLQLEVNRCRAHQQRLSKRVEVQGSVVNMYHQELSEGQLPSLLVHCSCNQKHLCCMSAEVAQNMRWCTACVLHYDAIAVAMQDVS